MQKQNMHKYESSILSLINGEIGVMATDTIYGLVCCALNENTVNRLYKLKNRAPSKPFIILISKLSDLDLFEIKLNDYEIRFLNQTWPGPVSCILKCPSDKFSYLHLGHQSLAFRVPNKQDLVNLISKTGPLIATSANPECLQPAKDIRRAKDYFGNKVDFYRDEGTLDNTASKIIKLDNANVTVIRS